MSKLKYDLRGVSSDKQEVHAAIKNLDKGLYPMAFCKILPDILTNDNAYCNIMHADTAGSKTALAYLYWRETGDLNVWKGIVQDALVMNLDDMACVGCVDDFIVSSTIGRNKHLISADVINTIIHGLQEFTENMAEYGIKLYSAGGETADVGDIVRTIDIGYTVFARMKRENLVVNAIRPNQVIIGLASYGKAVYEQTENSGIGSNGLTSARHDVLEKGYATNFPESYSNQIPLEAVYSGTKKLTDTVVFDEKIYEVGQLLLSPTRTFLPVLKAILEDARQHISGIIHCTGGGQTKVKKFIKNIHIVKDNLLPIPPVFKMIAAESNTPWAEMYQVFNMGTRLEIYTDAKYAENIIRIAQNFGIQAQIIGYTEASNTEKISIRTPYGEFQYA